jgi:hypothetical protein
MGHLIPIAALGALLLSFFQRDLYACAPALQRAILHFACRFLPEKDRDETFLQWHGDLCALPPSELLRTVYALDCTRGGAAIGLRGLIERLTTPKIERSSDENLEIRFVRSLTDADLRAMAKICGNVRIVPGTHDGFATNVILGTMANIILQLDGLRPPNKGGQQREDNSNRHSF